MTFNGRNVSNVYLADLNLKTNSVMESYIAYSKNTDLLGWNLVSFLSVSIPRWQKSFCRDRFLRQMARPWTQGKTITARASSHHIVFLRSIRSSLPSARQGTLAAGSRSAWATGPTSLYKGSPGPDASPQLTDLLPKALVLKRPHCNKNFFNEQLPSWWSLAWGHFSLHFI